MGFSRKLMGSAADTPRDLDQEALAWETVKAAGKQILYILLIIGAGVWLVLSVMVSIFTMPFKEGYRP